MRRLILFIALWLFAFPFTASAFSASCWVLTNLKGEAAYKGRAYKIEQDGFSHTNPSITLIFGGNRATASGDSIPLSQSNEYAATGAASNRNFSVTETYLVDPTSQTVLYTKSMFGYGPFADMTSTKMFRGNARTCK